MPDRDHRRIWVAWLGSWLYIRDVPTKPWRGGHTFPRTVTLKTFPEGIRLIQNPIVEMERLRGEHFNMGTTALKEKISVPAPSSNTYELIAEMEMDRSGKVAFDLCADDKQKTTITYDAHTETLTLDRSKSGQTDFSPSFPAAYSAPLPLTGNRLKLRILVDRSSVEVFANDGRTTITSQIFPDPDANQIYVYPVQGKVKLMNLDLWKLNSIWDSYKANAAE